VAGLGLTAAALSLLHEDESYDVEVTRPALDICIPGTLRTGLPQEQDLGCYLLVSYAGVAK
jgi:hypothetical protein